MSQDVQKFNTDSMEWEERFSKADGKQYFRKCLVEDPETDVKITITKYPAGFINVKHDHPCAHGMFVLKGILHTSEGDFGPNEFVWFPEGKVMWHGATADQDVEFVFITNKAFAINYLP